MLDENTGLYYYSKGIISLTPSESYILQVLISKGFAKDEEFRFSYSHIKALVCRINRKMKGELEIVRKCSKIYYLKYIGGKTNEITRSKRIYKRKLSKLPRTM